MPSERPPKKEVPMQKPPEIADDHHGFASGIEEETKPGSQQEAREMIGDTWTDEAIRALEPLAIACAMDRKKTKEKMGADREFDQMLAVVGRLFRERSDEEIFDLCLGFGMVTIRLRRLASEEFETTRKRIASVSDRRVTPREMKQIYEALASR